MKRRSSLPLLFLAVFSIGNCTIDAWTSSPATTNILATRRSNWSRTRTLGYVRRSFDRSKLLVHVKSDDNDDMDVVEEEFYSEYENMYSPNGETDAEKIEDTTTPPKNRKVELAKAWDEALIERTAGTSDATDDDSGGGARISNLSDLQKKLQQIQKRNKKGPIQDYSEGLANDTELPSEWDNNKKREVVEDNFMTNDQYLQILQKAQERLSKLTNSDSNSIQNMDKKTFASNMSSLQERLNQIQRDAAAKESSDIVSSSIDEPPKAKFLDDDTLAEWENLDNELQEERATIASNPPSSILKETTPKDFLAEEAAILDALRSQANDAEVIDIDGVESTAINNLEDRDKNLDPNAIPSEYKKFVADYELTEDGGVFLSPEAYQEASKNVNPDGSLNFGRGDNANDPGKPSSVESAVFDDEPPMAPYGDSGSAGTRKGVSIRDLTEEASRNLQFARNNPEAQEDLHRRLMAEFEAEEPTNDEFENELLLDPKKAFAFWNQEYMEEQKVEADALEDLLNQKMLELEKEEEQRQNEAGNNNSVERRIDAQNESFKGDENIFFASKLERIDRKRMIERNRRIRAKNIAKFYEESSEDNSWDSTSESKEVEEITRRQTAQKESADSKMDENSTEKIQENREESTPNSNNNDDVIPSTDEKSEDEKEWVFVEDPESPEDSFYWNEGTGEMRWDAPDEW